MTDSQYSGYSPNGQPPSLPKLPKPPQSQSGLAADPLAAKMSFLSMAEEAASGDSNSPSAISVGGGLKPRDIADYINQELRSPAATEHEKSPVTEPKKAPTLPANTMHPHRVWSRTANGGLQYTGMLSSDC